MVAVSVVVPAYNSQKYITETLTSILAQTGPELEIIVVDDHSSDRTRERVASFESPKIRLIALEKNHGGPSRPRNVGIAASRGKYIVLVDSDDVLLPGRIARSVSLLEAAPDLAMIFTDAVKWGVDEGGSRFLAGYAYFNRLRKQMVADGGYAIAAEDAFDCLLYENFILPSGVTARKEVLEALGGFDESLTNGDDRDMWFRVARNHPIGFIEEAGFRYRIHSKSISGRGACLAYNRIKVLRKLLGQGGLSRKQQTRIRSLVALNLASMGYHRKSQGRRREAREYYRRSLRESYSRFALKGYLATFLSAGMESALKRACLPLNPKTNGG